MARCENCDRELATQAQWDTHGDNTAECESGQCYCARVCWGSCEPYDWRAEALRLRGVLLHAMQLIEVVASTAKARARS